MTFRLSLKRMKHDGNRRREKRPNILSLLLRSFLRVFGPLKVFVVHKETKTIFIFLLYYYSGMRRGWETTTTILATRLKPRGVKPRFR